MNYHELTRENCLKTLGADADHGLSEDAAKRRLRDLGYNRLAEPKAPNIIVRFLAQLNDFMVLILLLAAVTSAVISLLRGERDFVDCFIILAIVFLNAVLGLFQEYRAEKALAALKKMAAAEATVVRGGQSRRIQTEQLVPGDIILLEAGDLVPADARLVDCFSLKAEEAALTGESAPSEKDADCLCESAALGDRHNMVFSGSVISYGRGKAVVTETGMNTEVGKIAGFIMESEDAETPLQKKLAATGKVLGITALIICGIVFAVGVLRNLEPFGMFMTSVSLAVAAIPEGLPAIVTIVLAIGVSRMAKKNAIIRKLPAVETLGQATVICSDKTGTLTQNRMKVTEITDGFAKLEKNSETRMELLRLAALCTDCRTEGDRRIGDPTELAISEAAELHGLNKSRLDKDYPRFAELPFDSARKLMSVVVGRDDGRDIITKGAPDVLLRRCTHYYSRGRKCELDEAARMKIMGGNEELASGALRVIAVAVKRGVHVRDRLMDERDEQGLCFIGLIGMMDPPRKEAAEAVRVCRKAGIHPVMITGDHMLTAVAVARKIGIMKNGEKAMTGEELSKLSDKQLTDVIEKYAVFARVAPEHKSRIVRAYQSLGHIVAMTGDGVNDAPALKAADIGCAMGLSGTDVAKGAADMILTDDNFATIVDSVREGRGIFENIRKSVHFLLSSNIGEILTIFTAIALGWAAPLLPVHLLWVNLVTDSLPAIALGVDRQNDDLMAVKPRRDGAKLFTGELWRRIVVEGCMIGVLALLSFTAGSFFFDAAGGHVIGRTMAFATLSISQLVHAFNMRSEHSLLTVNPFGNLPLLGALLVGIILQCSVIMVEPLAKIFRVVPLSPACWAVVALLSLMPLVIVEAEKLLTGRTFGVKAEE